MIYLSINKHIDQYFNESDIILCFILNAPAKLCTKIKMNRVEFLYYSLSHNYVFAFVIKSLSNLIYVLMAAI